MQIKSLILYGHLFTIIWTIQPLLNQIRERRKHFTFIRELFPSTPWAANIWECRQTFRDPNDEPKDCASNLCFTHTRYVPCYFLEKRTDNLTHWPIFYPVLLHTVFILLFLLFPSTGAYCQTSSPTWLNSAHSRLWWILLYFLSKSNSINTNRFSRAQSNWIFQTHHARGELFI